MNLNFHPRQELFYVIDIESLEERFVLELKGRLLRKFHLPLSIHKISPTEWVLYRLMDLFERLQVVHDNLKFIGDQTTVFDHGQEN